MLGLAPVRAGGPATRTVAIAGNPNSGKTTVFNALTGLRQKVANYPGVTVDKKTGRCRVGRGDAQHWVDVVDLPGTYSLIPSSPDEQVTTEILRGLRPDTPPPDALIAVIDASNLPRNLYLVSQLLELGRPLVVALNMTDIAERRGLHVDAAALARELGVQVVPMVGHRSRGVDDLKDAIDAVLAKPVPAPLPAWSLPAAMTCEMRRVGAEIGPDASAMGAIAHRLLIGDTAADISGHAARLEPSLARSRERFAGEGLDPVLVDIEARYAWIDGLVGRTVTRSEIAAKRTLTERVDGALMHPVLGLAIFAVVMAAVFVSVFWIAQPLMSGLQTGVDALGALLTTHLAPGPLKSLLLDGIVKGVGAVVVFVPQIAILFLFLAIMEDSGYLARAAFLMDRVLSKVGLHGKSFIPLLSSFACAIPGIMATRTIDSRKDRLATIMVAPFMSCSARLPVYFLLIGTFFAPFFTPMQRPFAQGMIMLGCYVLGIVAAAVVAWVFRRTLLRKGPKGSFILEMPSYKAPQVTEIARQVWVNSSKFLTKAGTIIFSLSVLLWALSYYPRLPAERASAIEAQARAAAPTASATAPVVAPAERDRGNDTPEAVPIADPVQERVDDAVASAQMANSYAGRFGHVIEPAIAPIGGDWKIGIGLIGAFAAREVFVSTLGIVYGVGDTETRGTTGLSEAIATDRRPDGSLVWTPLVAATLLVWFVLAMQCMSTIAVVRRETGGWAWPIFMIVYMNSLAYVACLAVFQVGSRIIG